MDDNRSVGALLGLVSAQILFFALAASPAIFRRKLLNCFSFLPSRVCPLVNLPSIKEPARPRYPLIQLKT
jgi:hypothetical protein